MEASKVDAEVCQIPPPYERLSWWKFNNSKYFLLLGYWYCEKRSEWRIEFLELGEQQSIIRSEVHFCKQIGDGVMVEFVKDCT